MEFCKRCGGMLVMEGGELKCLVCGWSFGSDVMSSEQAKEEVESVAMVEWEEYLASCRESRSARYGKSTPESIAEYKRRYHEAHHEKDLRDMLRWKRSHKAHLRKYRRKRYQDKNLRLLWLTELWKIRKLGEDHELEV